MLLNKKLKKTTFKTTFYHLMKNGVKSPNRTARNIIEAAQLFAEQKKSDIDLQQLTYDLQEKIKHQESRENLLNWLIQYFNL